jgi:hypothetical protein
MNCFLLFCHFFVIKKVTKKLFDCENSFRLVPRLHSNSLQPMWKLSFSLRQRCNEN